MVDIPIVSPTIQANQQNSNKKDDDNRCCLATTVLILGAIATLIAWRVSSPKDPHFFVDRASISGYNLTADDHLTSAFNLHVPAYNPNRNYFIYYDILVLTVYHNRTLLAYQVLPNQLSHHPKARVFLKAGLLARNVSLFGVDGKYSAAGLEAAASTAGTANLEVRVRAKTRFKYKGWKKFHHMMKAICSPVPVRFNSSSEVSGDLQTRCYVNVY